MAVIILEPGEIFEHTHSQNSTTDLQAGLVRCSYDDVSIELRPGNTVLIPAGVPHVLENIGEVPAHVGCRHIDVDVDDSPPKRPPPPPSPKPF
jgi:quercetin dioxygenase-like cupin family protein